MSAEFSSPAATTKRAASPIRVLILLTILAAAIGAYTYDYLVAQPGSERAYQDVQALVDERNSAAANRAKPATSSDVQKLIGFAPTFTQVEANHTIEWYCWWGWIPGLNTWKRYVTVVYVGHEPRHVNSHHLNEAPPEESLPKYYLPTGIAEPLPVPGPLGLGGPGGAAGDKGKQGESKPGETPSGENSGATGKLNDGAGQPTTDDSGKAD